MLFKILITIVWLFIGSSYTIAQNLPSSQTGCSVIDKQRPAQFISYVEISENRYRVKLRLRNNSTCPIIVETNQYFLGRFVKSSDGVFKPEPVSHLFDGIELSVHYLVRDRHKQTTKIGLGNGTSVSTYEIPAGESLTFYVLTSFLKKKLDVVVPFNFTWEGNSINKGESGTIHRIYFLFDNLPEDVFHGTRSNKSINRTRN